MNQPINTTFRKVTEEPTDYLFFGVVCTYSQFAAFIAMKNRGECPFCHRTGLTARYGSDRKHIAACSRKTKEKS